MKIAVTGATGFLGQYVVRDLLNRPNIEIIAVSHKAARSLIWGERVTHIQLDLSLPGIDFLGAIGSPDVVIHLAWLGLPNYSSSHHFETHLSEQYRFLSNMVKAGLPKLVCAGTCLEYGLQSGELNENMLTNPNTAYGFAKDALRRQLQLLQAAHHFELSWARLFYMFGEGQSETSLYSQLLIAKNRGDLNFNMSYGEQLRDYLPVSKVAEYISQLACDVPGQDVINVCSGNPISIRSLVEGWVLKNKMNIKLNLGHYPYVDYEPMAFWGSNSRLLATLSHSLMLGECSES